MRAQAATLPLLLLAACASALEEALSVEGNPHTPSGAAAATCCPAQALPPSSLLPMPQTLRTQHDTFVKLRTIQHESYEVPVFSFRQPSRLSHLMLPFDLVLVDDIDRTNIVLLPSEAAAAEDSWFPDYAWREFVVCVGAEGGGAGGEGAESALHLGWRFTRKAPGNGPASFIALIVRSEARQAVEPAAAGREAVGEAVRMRVGGAGDAIDEQATTPEALQGPHALSVGVRAPGWMMGLLAVATARSSPASTR